jgi:site-specific DNA-methyltransferase (cytosine-N4-specific)
MSRLHPYPAMVADDLARSLADQHVEPGARVLDPFCGSGRLLAASENASVRVGLDMNPLACLMTRAKLANASADLIDEVLSGLAHGRQASTGERLIVTDRKVDWFAPGTLDQLGRLVSWINGLRLAEPEALVVAAALSATVREVSFARQSGWKLHRLGVAARDALVACAWTRLERRLRYCLSELRKSPSVQGRTRILLADARRPIAPTGGPEVAQKFDVVLTSPPYGDSRTTVQYGAASALCLSVVSRLNGFEGLSTTGAVVDRNCLGGQRRTGLDMAIDPYWSGRPASWEGRLVDRFMADYDESCKAIAGTLVAGGKAVFVVGCRSVGGHRLALDRFTTERLEAYGMYLVSSAVRPLNKKRIPGRINRFGGSRDETERARGVIATMEGETILVLRKGPLRATDTGLPMPLPGIDGASARRSA